MKQYFINQVDEIYELINLYKYKEYNRNDIENIKLRIEGLFRVCIYCEWIDNETLVKHYNKLYNIMYDLFKVEISILNKGK